MKLIQKISEETIDILQNFFDNIMIYNCEGKLLYACEKFWKDTKLNPQEFCEKTIEDVSALGIYKPCAGEIAYQTKERATIVQRAFLDEISVVTALPIKDKNGEIFLYITYAENNDKIIELEDKLDQMNQYIIEKDKELIEIISHKFLSNAYVGKNNEVLKVQKLIERIADFDANVLLMGETGVGKTMHAEKIHSKGKRRNLPFIEINCAAIPETLLESELFGYEKGAFTGASAKGKIGQIELANGGTLFLDEISELSISLQSKLLKVIQDKQIIRIGGTKMIDVDFRLITASNKDLSELVKQGEFRADLYYRLNVIPIKIPALRERREDIIPFIHFFLDKFNKKYGENKHLSKRLLNHCFRYDWPGNVRELENTIERLVLTVENDKIDMIDLFEDETNSDLMDEIDQNSGLNDLLSSQEKRILTKTFHECEGNMSAMAKKLKISRQSIMRRLEKYQIQ